MTKTRGEYDNAKKERQKRLEIADENIREIGLGPLRELTNNDIHERLIGSPFLAKAFGESALDRLGGERPQEQSQPLDAIKPGG